MKGVPGVIALESQAGLTSSVTSLPMARKKRQRGPRLKNVIKHLPTIERTPFEHPPSLWLPEPHGNVSTAAGSFWHEARHHLQ